MNLVAFIQARLTSTRFPGKVYAQLGGYSVLWRVMEAATQIKNVREVRVLWPESFPDIPENDVLGRFWAGWRKLGRPYDGIVRITADCPFLDPAVCDLVVDQFGAYDGCDYASNVFPRRTFPDGLDCEIFTPDILERAARDATAPGDREHVTPWMQRTGFCRSVTLPIDWSWVRLTVDTEEDLKWLNMCLTAPRSPSWTGP